MIQLNLKLDRIFPELNSGNFIMGIGVVYSEEVSMISFGVTSHIELLPRCYSQGIKSTQLYGLGEEYSTFKPEGTRIRLLKIMTHLLAPCYDSAHLPVKTSRTMISLNAQSSERF